jgi:hypothetical protein
MLATYIFAGVIVLLLSWVVLWVTKKAYSKKWEGHDE